MSVGAGKSFPLGASMQPGGVNFSLFSEHATAVRLLLFDRAEDGRPARAIELDPRRQRTYHYWHVFVPGLEAGQLYGWRVEGPRRPDLKTRIATEGIAAMLLVDVSGSMAEPWPDENLNRLEAAKQAFELFVRGGEVEGLTLPGRPTDLLGYIAFARRPISKMSGRSSGSPPDRISTGTRNALRSSMTRNTSSVDSSPGKSLSAEIE